MKKRYLLIFLFFSLLPLSFASAQEKNPKLVNYFLHWSITEDEAKDLAKWDLLILDMEVQENSPLEMSLIRKLNPKIKILAYIPSQNLFDPSFNRNEAVLRKKMNEEVSSSWWLKSDSGKRLSDWPEAYILNLTDYCGADSQGQRFSDYLSSFVSREIISTGLWDGVFYDNIWNSASWLNAGNVSLSANGKRNTRQEIDDAWKNGVKKLLIKTRQLLGPDMIILGNGNFITDYQPYLNGWMLEDFPTPWENGGSWSGVVKSYLNLPNTNKFNIINAASSSSYDYAKFRYALASSLLGNSYFSFDYGPSDHSQFWWFDEYNIDLGSRQGAAYNILEKNNPLIKPGLWRRDFKNGIALVNSTEKEQNHIFSKEEFERLRGTQDPITNNGQKINSIRLAAHDGVILLKRPTIIRNSWFINGNFFRVFNSKGEQVQNGFFAYNDSFPGSTPLLFHTLINDDEQVLSSNKGDLAFFHNGRKTGSFRPYGNFKGIFSLAVSNVMDDNNEEIITGAGMGGGPNVAIFDFKGKIKSSFFAYDKNFRGGVNVAVGDVDGDGQMEIITGAGKGSGPQVMIMDYTGNIKSNFFAYDKNYKDGVFVATYDINSDGVDEILTGISNF